MLLLLEFLAEMLMLKRGQKPIIIKLLSCVFSDLKRIIADITGPYYSVLYMYQQTS